MVFYYYVHISGLYIARIVRMGVTWVSDVYVCMHKHARLGGSGDMLPQEKFRN